MIHLINSTILQKYKRTWIYALILAFLLSLLKWLELSFIFHDLSLEIYIGATALLFTFVGMWMTPHFYKRSTSKFIRADKIEKPDKPLHLIAIQHFSLSIRELEVLQLMSYGLSNQEMADRLFVSLNTIKTHCSNIYMKLEVKRRTQAIEKALRLKLIIQNHPKV